MQNNNDNKKRSSLSVLLAVGMFMVILNYLLADAVALVGQEPVEETTEVIEETEQVEEELHRVYSDLGLEDKKHNLDISTDETYFSYKCYYEIDVLDLISKIEKSDNYMILNITREGSYTYIIFKYTENVDDEQIEDNIETETEEDEAITV